MLKTVLSISGRPGLFKLVSQGKNMLIVEAIGAGKRIPAYAHDKVISLGDIAIYTIEEDIPLADVFESIKENTQGKVVDTTALKSDKEIREYFATILPNFDDERVYTNDIKKVFNWYNVLVSAGMTDFKSVETEEAETSVE
jgi:hypothetical protein